MIAPTLLQQKQQSDQQQGVSSLAQPNSLQQQHGNVQPNNPSPMQPVAGGVGGAGGSGSDQSHLALEIPMAPDPANQLIPIVPPVPLMNSLVSTNKVVLDHSMNPTPAGMIAPGPLVDTPLVAAPLTPTDAVEVPGVSSGLDGSSGQDASHGTDQQDEDSPMTGPTNPPPPPPGVGSIVSGIFVVLLFHG
jgi:hypothetical protein